MTSQLTTRRFWLIWGAIIGIYGLLAARCLQYSIDDFYIILRYVQNAVDGHGLVYNIGERIEGYTCFSWVVFLVFLGKLGLPVFWAAKIVGWLCGVGVLWIVYSLGLVLWKDRENQKSLSLIPVVLTAVNPVFVYWSVGGLETMLFCMLVMAAMYMLLRDLDQGSSSWRTSVAQAALCASAALTRPEGVAMGCFVFAVRMLMIKRPREWLNQGLFILAFTLPVLLHLLWRLHYYGDLLPNTYHAKAAAELPERLLRGKYYLQEAVAFNTFGWLGHSGQSVLPGLLLFVIVPILAVFVLKRKRLHIIAGAFICMQAAIIVWEGGDWMPLYRFTVPLVALSLLVMVHSIQGICDWRQIVDVPPSPFRLRRISEKSTLPETGRAGFIPATDRRHEVDATSGEWSPLRRIPSILALGCSVFLVVMTGEYVRLNRELPVGSELVLGNPSFHEIDEPISWAYRFSNYIEANGKSKGTVALSDIGYLGFRTGYRVIDMAGLVDRKIAHSPGASCQKDYDVSYVLDQDPDFMVLTRQFLPGRKLAADARFLQRYQFVEESYKHYLYERKRE